MKSGFLLIDKPAGITSFDVIRIARKKLQIKKMGHAGTLDPFATGLLLVAVGEGTKALSHILLSTKTYRTKIVFGLTSDTLDPEGEISITNPAITNYQIKEELPCLLRRFVGKISQIPPKYSALKIQGKRACDRMRAGEEVEIQPRETELFSAELLGVEEKSFEDIVGAGLLPAQATTRVVPTEKFFLADIRIHVKTGFYVRSFARDLGEVLKTCAFCVTLRREKIGDFSLDDALSPDNISEKNIIPVQSNHFPFSAVSISDEQREDFIHGRSFSILEEGSEEKVIFYKKKWLGFAEYKEGRLFPKKVVHL